VRSTWTPSWSPPKLQMVKAAAVFISDHQVRAAGQDELAPHSEECRTQW
jgi:hypothetical protein